MNMVIRITGEYPSTITVGHGLGSKPVYGALDEAATKALATHAYPLASQVETSAQYLRERGIEASTAGHPDAEAGRSVEAVASLWDGCGRLQLGRKDAIVAMDGGAATDMVGFVAATWLHGVTFINAPVTLLAMVDVAVGGKAGISTSTGRDLVGSFCPVTSVVADMDLLESLPTPDLATGTAEAIKCGSIADPEALRIVEGAEPNELLRSYNPQLVEITTRAIAVRACVASANLMEGGPRGILNHGHTLAHAIERASGCTWRHSNTVAIGCCFTARLAQVRGPLSADDVSRRDQFFSHVGLPIRYKGNTLDELTHIMLSDKKVRRGILRSVFLDGIADLGTVFVDPQELRAPASQTGIRA